MDRQSLLQPLTGNWCCNFLVALWNLPPLTWCRAFLLATLFGERAGEWAEERQNLPDRGPAALAWLVLSVLAWSAFIFCLTCWCEYEQGPGYAVGGLFASAFSMMLLVAILCTLMPFAEAGITKFAAMLLSCTIIGTSHHFIYKSNWGCDTYVAWIFMVLFGAKCIDPTDRLEIISVTASSVGSAIIAVYFSPSFHLYYVQCIIFGVIVFLSGFCYMIDNRDGPDSLVMAWIWVKTALAGAAAT